MARKVYGSLDISDNQLLNALLQQLPSDPTSLESKIYYNTTAKEIRFHNGTTWVALGPAGAGGPPTGGASGDLTGSYPSPQIAAGVIVDADVNSGAGIQQSKIASLTTDLAARALTTTDHIAGAGLTGGGTLAASRTFAVGAGTGITVNADDVQVNRTVTDTWYLGKSGGAASTMDAATDLTLARDPTSALHAATKQYVDITSQGFSFKNAVRVVSTTNQAALSGLLTIDGVTLVANDRVLLAAQTTASQNGIYLASSGAWTRATDMDASGELVDGTLVPVGAGTVNADSQWMCTAIGATPWVPNSSTSTWTKYAQLADLVAGNGLVKTGSTVDIVVDATLTAAADQLSVVSAPKLTTARTISLTGDVTGSASFDGTANISIATTGGGKRYAAALTASTSQVVTHSLNTRDVVVQVYNSAANYEEIDVEVQRTSVNTITVIANPALPAGYRVVVLA